MINLKKEFDEAYADLKKESAYRLNFGVYYTPRF